MRRHPVIQMVAIGAIASAIGIALSFWIRWFPVDAAKQDKPIDTLYHVLMIVSIPIFVLVTTVILYSVWAFRMRPGQEGEDGPPIHGNTRLEVVWTAIPAILLVSLCSYAYGVLTDIEKTHKDELVVKVHAVQFAWSFSYPQAGGRPAVTSDQLYLPANRPVRFDIDTQDVIHDFWVPAFRVKIDTVPGIVTHLRVTPTKLGSYPIVCAELCGLGHSVMRSTAHVLTPAAYARWLAQKQAPATPGGAGGGAPSQAQLIALGRQAFTGEGGCGACHTLADAGTNGTAGPDLRLIRGQSQAEIRQDIVDPNARITPGYQANIMPPTFGQTLSAQQLDGLVAYLASVSK